MLQRLSNDRSGASAVEMAVVAPLLCFVLLGIADGWSHASYTLDMQAAVKAGANYVLQGGDSETATHDVALSAWVKPPTDANVVVEQLCYCGSVSAQCSVICTSSAKPPSGYLRIAASGTWVPPVQVRFLLEPVTKEYSEMIRVR